MSVRHAHFHPAAFMRCDAVVRRYSAVAMRAFVVWRRVNLFYNTGVVARPPACCWPAMSASERVAEGMSVVRRPSCAVGVGGWGGGGGVQLSHPSHMSCSGMLFKCGTPVYQLPSSPLFVTNCRRQAPAGPWRWHQPAPAWGCPPPAGPTSRRQGGRWQFRLRAASISAR